jgi:hypothetical protein
MLDFVDSRRCSSLSSAQRLILWSQALHFQKRVQPGDQVGLAFDGVEVAGDLLLKAGQLRQQRAMRGHR